MKRGRDRSFRAKVLLEMADAARFYLRDLRGVHLRGFPEGQRDAASLNLAVAVQNLEEAATRLSSRYRIRRQKKAA